MAAHRHCSARLASIAVRASPMAANQGSLSNRPDRARSARNIARERLSASTRAR